MSRHRHTGPRGCVIMYSRWKHLTIPDKETDHENPRLDSHPGRHRRQPTAPLVFDGHGFPRPLPGRITHQHSPRSRGDST